MGMPWESEHIGTLNVKDKKRHQNMALSDMNQARYPQVAEISK